MYVHNILVCMYIYVHMFTHHMLYNIIYHDYGSFVGKENWKGWLLWWLHGSVVMAATVRHPVSYTGETFGEGFSCVDMS